MKKFRILIVDDDSKLSLLIQTMVEAAGIYETMVENRPYHVLATARTFKPDLALLDVDMPGKDGGDVAREMKADPLLKDVAVIFLTSLVRKHEAGVRQVPGGNERFLSKPTDSQTLLGAIEEALAARSTTEVASRE